MIVYNLFPPLAGTLPRWRPHVERASRLGFDWVFINPIQRPGFSGSLYSIKDHFAINPLLVEEASPLSGVEQAKHAIAEIHELGLKVMVDLVVNHTAIDSELTRSNPGWYLLEDGDVQHPSCIENGEKIVWGDLAQLNHQDATDPEGLFAFLLKNLEFLLELGIDGFRCDAAYQVPRGTWERLIEAVKSKRSDVIFAAETLGCTPEETVATARAGFDYTFNSSKWWDFESGWLLQQYDLGRAIAPSIGFPESHDTERLFEESGGSVAAMKQRYLFTALFSTGVMMPMGFEYGFRRRMHVVKTRASDWEEPSIDLTEFIRAVNRVKRQNPVFSQEGPVRVLPKGTVELLVFHKTSTTGDPEGVVILNKDLKHRHAFEVNSVRELFGSSVRSVVCISPENPLRLTESPFHYELREGEAVVMVEGR